MTARAKALLALSVALTVSMSAVAGDASAEPELYRKAIDNWWVLADGKTLIVQADKKAEMVLGGTVKVLDSSGNDLSHVVAVGKDCIAYELVNESFSICKDTSKKPVATITGEGKYAVLAVDAKADWMVVMAVRTDPEPKIEFHQIDLKTVTAKQFYTYSEDNAVRHVGFTRDHKSMILWTDPGDGKTLTKRTLEIATAKVATESVPVHQVFYPLPDGSGHVIRKKNKLYVVRGGKETCLFEGKHTATAKPNLAVTPTILAVSLLTDTDKDGKLSAEDGDDIALYAVDLRTLDKQLIADSDRINEMRRWSQDGNCLAFKRWEPPDIDSPRRVGALVVYDATTKKTHYAFPAKGSLSVRFVKFLPGGWALASDINLLSKEPSKETPFLFGFRHGERRVDIPAPKKTIAVAGKWLLMSDHDEKALKPSDLYRWKLPAE